MTVESYAGCVCTSGIARIMLTCQMKVLALLTHSNMCGSVFLKGISDILTQQYLIIAFQRVHISSYDESPCHIKKI